MIARAFIARNVPAKQTQDFVAIPAIVPNSLPHEVVVAVDPIPVMFRLGQERLDFAAHLRRDPFVGIDEQNPFMGGLRDGPILEVTRGAIFAFNDPAATNLTDDLERTIGRSGIGNQDLIGDRLKALDARANIQSFVLAGDQNCQTAAGRAISHGECFRQSGRRTEGLVGDVATCSGPRWNQPSKREGGYKLLPPGSRSILLSVRISTAGSFTGPCVRFSPRHS